ncbi:MAG TPA: hypothetical protein VGI80_05810, partial [Pyrinomonadaceae bacterium]
MSESDAKIAELEARLDSLVRTQIDFQVEVTAIRNELTRLRDLERGSTPAPRFSTAARPVDRLIAPPPESARPQERSVPPPLPRPIVTTPVVLAAPEPSQSMTSNFLADYVNRTTEAAKANVEEFIGENLISKVGIVILLLGIGIGVKYAIDND